MATHEVQILRRQVATLDALFVDATWPEEQGKALAQCSVSPQLGSHPMQWWLSNVASPLTCAVNAVQLAHNEGVLLQPGDVIELGLLRIQFELAVVDLQEASRLEPKFLEVTPVAPHESHDIDPNFQLIDLLQVGTNSTRHASSRQDWHDPVADIVDAVNIRSESGQAPIFTHTPAPTKHTEASAAATDHAVSPKALRATEFQGIDEVMGNLHKQYLHLMQNPHDAQFQSNWKTQGPTTSTQAKSFDHWVSDAKHLAIYDILGHSKNIDPILSQLDVLSEANILRPPEHVDVLRQFAPETLKVQAAALPSLTRREHHHITADSALNLDPIKALNLSDANLK